MSDTQTHGGGQSSTGPRDANDGTAAAIETFVGRNILQGRYLLLALALAVVWWLAIGGPLSTWIAALGFVVLALGMQGFITAVLARRWPQTEAVILSSEVLTEPEAREKAGLDAVEGADSTHEFAGGYVPLVRYEYTVDGQRYVNAIISPFDDTLSKRRQAKALVDAYPENSRVSLRYDSDDPTQSFLRPWIRSTAGMISAFGIPFLLGAAWFGVGMPGGAAVAPLAIGIPVTALGVFRIVTGLRSRRWPTTTGTVTATGVDAMGGSTEGSGGLSYAPGMQYEYTVDGTSYVSSRYALSPRSEPGFESRDEALSWIEDNYPVGAEVSVHYDPNRPDRGVLVPGGSRSLMPVLIGLSFTGIGVFALLFPSTVAF